MPNVVDSKLRDVPLENTSDEKLLWFLNREMWPTLRRVLSFLNISWGQNVLVTADHAVAPSDEYLRVDATDGPLTITLRPSLDAELGVRELTIKKIDLTENVVSVVAASGDDIDDVSLVAMSGPNSSAKLRPRLNGWDVVSGAVVGTMVSFHQPCMIQELSVALTVPTGKTMLAHNLTLRAGGDLRIEGTGEILYI